MVIYRPNRELLDEAMEEAKEFETIDDMKRHIVKENTDETFGEMVSFEDISLDTKRCVNDDRIGWRDTRYVLASRYWNKFGTYVIGYCATDYEKR